MRRYAHSTLKQFGILVDVSLPEAYVHHWGEAWHEPVMDSALVLDALDHFNPVVVQTGQYWMRLDLTVRAHSLTEAQLRVEEIVSSLMGGWMVEEVVDLLDVRSLDGEERLW